MDDIKELLSSLHTIESSGVAGIQNKAKLTVGRNGASPPLISPGPATQKARQPDLGRLKRAFQVKGGDNEVVPDNTQCHRPPFLSASDPIDALDLLEAADHQSRPPLRTLPPLEAAFPAPVNAEQRFLEQVEESPIDGLYLALQRHSTTKRNVPPLVDPPRLPKYVASSHSHERECSKTAQDTAHPASVPRLNLRPFRIDDDGSPVAPEHSGNRPLLLRESVIAATIVSSEVNFQASLQKHKIWTEQQHATYVAERRTNSMLSHAYGYKVQSLLDSSKRTLPLEYLVDHNMGNFAAGNGMEKIIKAIEKLMLRSYGEGISRWRYFIEQSRLQQLDAAVRVVQSEWRGGESRQWVREARKKSNEVKSRRLRALEGHKIRRTNAARSIIGALRRHRFRCVVWDIVERIRMARVLQRGWESKLARDHGWAEIARYIVEQRSAEKIQRIFRAFIGRKRFKKHKMVAHHMKNEERFVDPHTTLIANFEMHGAAKKLQHWWTYLPWRSRRRWRRLRLYYTKRIQRSFRSAIARRKVTKLRKEKEDKLRGHPKEYTAASLIQRIARGYLIRAKYTGKLGSARAARLAERDEMRKVFDARFKNNLLLKNKYNKAAVKVQRVLRGHFARKKFEIIKLQRLEDKVIKIQRTITHFLWMRKRVKAANFMQTWLRRTLASLILKKRAAVVIQTHWRACKAKSTYFSFRRAARHIALYFVPMVRDYIHRLATRRDYTQRIWDAENRLAGAKSFNLSREDEIKRQTLTMTQIDDPEIPAETQAIYVYYCSFGSRGNNRRLGVNNFTKLCKECPHLIDSKSLNQQDCELIFKKSLGKLAGGGTESHLHYADFLVALGHVADAKLKSTNTWGHRLQGSSAKLVKLLQQYIFKCPAAMKVIKELKSQAAPGRADTHIRNAAGKIQRSYRGYVTRCDFRARRGEAGKLREHQEEIEAAICIQKAWLGKKARLHVVTVAKSVWEKYVDHETGREYWYNTRTAIAVWKKPKALGRGDIGNPVKMPQGVDVFTVHCKECVENLGTTFCIECNQLHCKDCSRQMHGKGRRQGHDIVELEVCIQCGFQVGTRFCYTCKDNYCDTCFEDQHSKGMLQRHEYKPLVYVCEECGKRGARQIVNDEFPGKAPTRKLCNGCTTLSRKVAPGAGIEELIYRPFRIDEFLTEKQAEKERRDREELFNTRKREAREKYEQLCSSKIQRLWRGYISRVRNAAFVAERREWMKQRLVDNRVRNSIQYQMMDFFGVAQELESDAVSEKVLKRYPRWERKFISDVVHSEWQLCYDLIAAQEKHQKHQGLTPPSLHVQEITKLFILRFNLKLKMMAERAKKKSADKAHQAYRNARSANEAEDIKAELQQTMRRAKKDYEQALEQRQVVLEEYEELLHTRSGRWGPRGMPKRLREVRKKGWAVRFKVDASFASALLDHPFDQIPSSIKMGDYVRVGESAATYKVVRNTGLPSFSKAMYFSQVDRWVRFAASLEGLDSTEEEDRAIIESRIPKWKSDETELRLLKLDRSWTYDDAKELELFKLPRLSPSWKAYFYITRTLKGSPPVQFVVATYASAVGSVASRFRKFADNFDDDSKNYIYMVGLSDRTEAFRRRIIHMRQTLKPSEGDTLLGDLKGFLRTLKRLLRKFREHVFAEIEAYRERQRKAKDPFVKWLESPDQVEIKVLWNDGTDERPLGFLKIDRGCPLLLGREFVHRYLWFELNTKALGKKFQYQAKGEGLSESKEEKMTFNSVVAQKLNENREAEYVLTLCPEPDAEKEDIEAWDWEAERLREEERKKHMSKEELEELELWADEDEDDDSQGRFPNVEAQKHRHMEELKKIRNVEAGAQEIESADMISGGEEEDGGGPAAEDGLEQEGIVREKEDWIQDADENGNPFWYNTETGDSTYEDPNSNEITPQNGYMIDGAAD